MNDVAPEQLRLDQKGIASACIQPKARKRVRYINSAVAPADGRPFDLFGADGIVEILDLTPSFIQRSTSRPRRSLQWAAGGGDSAGKAKGPRTP